MLDDEHLAFTEVTGNQTWRNVRRGSRVAIAAVDRETLKGFRFVGGLSLSLEKLRSAD